MLDVTSTGTSTVQATDVHELRRSPMQGFQTLLVTKLPHVAGIQGSPLAARAPVTNTSFAGSHGKSTTVF